MSTAAIVRIETWGGKFVVIGEFGEMIAVPRREFDTYGEALKEMSRILMREVQKYETDIRRDADR